ncbi:MAG: pyridoxal phosphate-dependent aminotransferase [Chloroflexi bacterium]|nr:pyridoxal phosphate-dependent aminotransferase [Chloroflexota bacterium]
MIMPRTLDVRPFLVMEVLEEADRLRRQGIDVVRFEIGEPDFDTPTCVREAAEAALRAGETHYTHSLGLRELREAIAEHYGERYGAAFDPDQVLVTSGTSPAMLLLFGALLNPGDEVVVSNPCYACYPNFIRFAGGVPVFVDTFEEEGYRLRPEAIQARLTPRTRAILVNSPANPTGVVMDRAALQAVADLGLPVISDEIYHGLTYEGEEHSILECAGTDRAVVLNGFSKRYAMTGWRLGYVVASPDLVRAMQKLQQNVFISASAFVQRAAIAALRQAGPDVERMRQSYAERRRAMLHRLAGMGLAMPVPPTGAFYLLVNVRAYTGDSLAFAFELLRNAHVACAPGIDFGSNAEGYLRFSYATSLENIERGMDRLEAYLTDRVGASAFSNQRSVSGDFTGVACAERSLC